MNSVFKNASISSQKQRRILAEAGAQRRLNPLRAHVKTQAHAVKENSGYVLPKHSRSFLAFDFRESVYGFLPVPVVFVAGAEMVLRVMGGFAAG